MKRVYQVLDLLLALCDLVLGLDLLLVQTLVAHAYTRTYALERLNRLNTITNSHVSYLEDSSDSDRSSSSKVHLQHGLCLN